MGKIDQIAEMAQAKALLLEFLFQFGERNGVFDPILLGMDGGFPPGSLQVDHFIQRNYPAADLHDRALGTDVLLLPIPVQSGGQQVFQRIGGEAVQRETGVICDIDDGGIDLVLPQKVGQLYAVIPIQLDVQHQELVDVRVLCQPFHERSGRVEHLNVVVLPPNTAFSIQHMAGGCFILFRCARVIFTYGDAVHDFTSVTRRFSA